MSIFSPKKKKDSYKKQLESNTNFDGAPLTENDIAYRRGYIKAVNEGNAIYAYKNATPEARAAYKKKKAEERSALREEFNAFKREQQKGKKKLSNK